MSLKYLIPPEEGFEQCTYYVAEVSAFPGNPIHSCILAVGFCKDGIPSDNSSYIFNRTYDSEATSIKELYYIKAIKKIDITVPNRGKLVSGLQNIFELEQYNLQRTQK